MLRAMTRSFLLYSSFLMSFASFAKPPQVVALQYHHVSTSTPAITSVSPAVFEEHMEYLEEHHTVIALKDALEAIKNNKSLPDNAVTITFDDGYKNILENAHPILEKYQFPYTIFINPLTINARADQLTWDEVKSMQPLADFANHTLDHIHMLQRKESESEKVWLKRVTDDVLKAEAILADKLGYSRKWLAYPFGEFNRSLKDALEQEGFIAFGQQSGVISTFSDFTALPRFPSSGIYGNLDTLKVKMAALAMPVESVQPAKNEMRLGDKLETLKLSLLPSAQDIRRNAMGCFFKGERIDPEVNGDTISIDMNTEFSPGRTRINCTAPSSAHPGRFYWYSVPFFTPTESGIFLD